MKRLSILLTALVAAGCVSEGPLKEQGSIVPRTLNDGWQISTPAAEGFDAVELGEALDLFWSTDGLYNAVSLLVARNGRLVVEAYTRPWRDRDIKRNVQSVTKSVNSLVFGIARDQGYFADLDTLLYDILPDAFDDDPDKRSITLRHLLTMRSGIAFDNDHFANEMVTHKPADQARYILHKPLFTSPGTEYLYRDADPHLLSCAFQAVTGRSLSSFAEEFLFEPLGISDWFWEAYGGGTSTGATGLFLRPRDMAKIGELMRLRGAWGAEQIVSTAWVDSATATQTATDDPDYPYGFYWWMVPEIGAFTAWGHGGQYIMIVPDRDMVVVLTSLPSSGDDAGTSLDEFMPVVRHLVAATVP